MLDKQDMDLFILRCINNGWMTRVLKTKPVSKKYWKEAKKFRVNILLAAFVHPENIMAEIIKGERFRRELKVTPRIVNRRVVA